MEHPRDAKIKVYLLPFDEPPTTDSIAVQRNSAWFQTRMRWIKGLGQITLIDSEAVLNHYLLPSDSAKESLSLEGGRYKLRSHSKSVGQGIAVQDGSVWYGEIDAIIRMVQTSPTSQRGVTVPKELGLCRFDAESKKMTRYISKLPEDTFQSATLYRMALDTTGSKAWGTSLVNCAWVFDIARKKLGTIVVGKAVEKEIGGSTTEEPEHMFRDVVVEPDGKRAWLLDMKEALYFFDLEEESMRRYRAKGFRLNMMDIAADGKVWFTSVNDRSGLLGLTSQDQAYPPVEMGHIHSLDPSTSELMTYVVPHHLRPNGILATQKGEIWFCFSPGINYDGGIARLDLEKAKGMENAVTPEKTEDWRLLESEATEVNEEAPSPDTFDIPPDQPIKREYTEELRLSTYDSFIIYSAVRPHRTLRDLAEDNQGRIWFTTWSSGYIGLLTP